MLAYQSDTQYNEVIHFLKTETPKPATVMIIQNKGDALELGGHRNYFGLDLMRRTERDNFVHFKLIASTPQKMYEWYQRLKITEQIERHPERLQEILQAYEVDYILTVNNLELPAEQVFENKTYQIYKLL